MDTDQKQLRYSKRALIFFFVSVIILSIIVEAVYAFTRSDLLVMILMWVPGIMGLIAAFLSIRDSVREHARDNAQDSVQDRVRDDGERVSVRGVLSLIGIRKSKVAYICLGVILPLIYLFIPYRIYWTMHPEHFSGMGTSFVALIIYAVIYVLVSMLTALGEELGWRGFLLPAQLERMSFAKAVVIVNLFWCVWHFGLLIFGGYMEGTPLWYKLIAFTLCVFPVGVIAAVLSVWSKSVWPAAFLHAAHNAYDQALFGPVTQGADKMYFVSETGVFTIVCAWIIAIVMVVVYVKRRKKANDIAC